MGYLQDSSRHQRDWDRQCRDDTVGRVPKHRSDGEQEHGQLESGTDGLIRMPLRVIADTARVRG